jgi:hypothetical protein
VGQKYPVCKFHDSGCCHGKDQGKAYVKNISVTIGVQMHVFLLPLIFWTMGQHNKWGCLGVCWHKKKNKENRRGGNPPKKKSNLGSGYGQKVGPLFCKKGENSIVSQVKTK